jgi:cytochrome c oxidase assembly protein subunit 11
MSERSQKFTGLGVAAIALAMLGLAFASVPLYRIFCQATGFGGTTQRAAEGSAPGATGQVIKVRFDSNVAPDLPWKFEPVERTRTIRLGERKLAFFRATNLSDHPITGVATFNVSPDTAGQYFVKIQCFCFSAQTLQPGETVDMPVSYYVDPAIREDDSAKRIDEITLSYTFFPREEEQPKNTAETAAASVGSARTQG